jgi:hypothetical protein
VKEGDVKHNPVAKNCRKFNRASVHKDKKKAERLGEKNKYPLKYKDA